MLTIKNRPASHFIRVHDSGSRIGFQSFVQLLTAHGHSFGQTKMVRSVCLGLAFTFLACAVLLLAGCTPPGPRAVLGGKRLLDQEKYQQAAEKLKTATSLLTTNAQVWNYYGLALHQCGQAAEAEKAYQRALLLNQDLSE